MLLLCGEEEIGAALPDGLGVPFNYHEAEEEVTLNSLVNPGNPRIFRLEASHGTHTFEVLIDSGAHNNFIHESLVAKLGLPTTPTRRFSVYMGNGQSLVCDKQCSAVSLVL